MNAPIPEEDFNETPTCAKCGEEYSLDYGMEPTKYCHECAHEVAESADERIAALEQERDQLRAEVERLREDVDQIAECSLRIRSLTSLIRTHRCTEASKPDYGCNDPGMPSCTWSDAEKEDYCENCKVAEQARRDRTKEKLLRNKLVRKIAARRKP